MRSVVTVLVPLALLAPLVGSALAEPVYTDPVWFQWGKAALNVWIVPPTHGQLANGNSALNGNDPRELDPLQNSYTRATLDSIANWQTAIDAYAPAWLKTRLDIDVYLLGRDVPTVEETPAQTYPDIVIVFDEEKANILGVAISPSSPRPCIVDNSRMFTTSFTYEDMFNINGQEYGHCLGLNHVTDNKPANDVMNGAYAYSPGARGNPLNCVSDLDVNALEGVFARSLGQPTSAWGRAGQVTASAYAKVPC